MEQLEGVRSENEQLRAMVAGLEVAQRSNEKCLQHLRGHVSVQQQTADDVTTEVTDWGVLYQGSRLLSRQCTAADGRRRHH